MKYEIIKFIDGEFELDVNVSPEEDTVWLNAKELAFLFDRDESVINKHIRNIYKEGELDRETTEAKNAFMLNWITRVTIRHIYIYLFSHIGNAQRVIKADVSLKHYF